MVTKLTVLFCIAALCASPIWAKSSKKDQELEAQGACADCAPSQLNIPTENFEQKKMEDCWRKHFLDAAKRKVDADFNR